jgi:acyl-coenzyme A thioesterase PaaI-like protein
MRTTSDEFLAHWNAVLVAGEDMALTLGLEPLSGDPAEVIVTMALTPAIRQPAGMFSAASLFGLADVSGTTLARYHARPTPFPSLCNPRFRSSETRTRAMPPAARRS